MLLSRIQHVAMIPKLLQLVSVILISLFADGNVYGGETISLERSFYKHDAIIGSDINITCQQRFTTDTSCLVTWLKNFKRLGECKNSTRIVWLQGSPVNAYRCSVAKLMIRNITASDTGLYSCIQMGRVTNSHYETDSDFSKMPSLKVFAVLCYQGYYCPNSKKNSKPIRCPLGTFSLYKNATSLQECTPCPTYKSERDSWTRSMEPRTVAMFQTNCHASPQGKESTSNQSTGVAVASILIPVVAGVCLVTGVLYVLYHWRNKTKCREKSHGLSKEVIYDPLKLPRSKDVFVCYSSKNRDWVHDVLFPNLKAQDFKVFIDFIDFEIGVTIDDNIVNGIYGSRKTLFILSKDSLKSLYARKELYHALAAGKTGHQVLVILYEKCKAPAEIADLVYLDWTDLNHREMFWDRLYRAIRRPLANEVVDV